MLRAVIQDDVDFKPLSVRGVERIGLEFIASMIDIDGELRPSAKDLLRHPWVCHVHDIVRIPNLEESQIFNNPANEVLETLDEEEVWDGLQSESFLKATRALIKTPTPDAPSLTNGETSADDKIPVTENDCSDSSSQINIESVVASQISAELANPQNHKWDNGPATGLAQASQSWFKKSWPSYYAQGDQIAGGASGSEDDTPRQGRSNRLFGEVSQDPNEESSIFGGESQPTIRPLERSQQSPPHNSASLFGTESRMNNLNMKVSRPNKSSVLRSAVTNSMIHGKRYRSTATSGSDESNTSSIDEPAAKRSMVRLSESLHINENTRSEPDPQSLDVNRSLSQQVVNLQLSGTCLATLIPIPGCLSSKEVSLTTRLSTFGRAVVNTNVYEDATDSRIPRSAFDIYFFSPGSAHIRGKEWYKDPDVNAVIMTRCSTGIKVNGCHLPPSNLGNVFKVAKLRTGDLIEVYNSGRNKLVYRCDFHVSESKFPRGADEDVVVEDNTELFEAASSSGGNLTNAGAAEPLI